MTKKRKTPKPTKIIQKYKKNGIGSLTPKECCVLLDWHLGQIGDWEQAVWDTIWGAGGGAPPPPPPKWPPA